MHEVSSKSILVSPKGGTLDFVRDGEVLVSIRVPAGRVPVSDYWDLVPHGCEVQISDGLVVLNRRSGFGLDAGRDRHESGANPDFVPTSATAAEVRMRRMMLSMQAQSDAIERRSAALALIDVIPRPKPDADPVVVEPIVDDVKK